jgi:hypothetical protein
MESIVSPLLCPFCSSSISPTDYFCPTCGKNVREKPISTSLITQIGLYAVSAFLPPLFLGWTIKYLKSSDPKAKQIGFISLGVMIVSILTALFLSFTFVKNLSQEATKQLNQYQDLGL